MAHQNLQHRRTHNTLLISRLLNQREGASPLTLILDTLEQPATTLIKEYVRRANLGKSHTIYIAFTSPRKPSGIDSFISAWDKSPQEVLAALTALTQSTTGAKRYLIIVDDVHVLCVAALKGQVDLTAFFATLLRPSGTIPASAIAVYHTDVPLSVFSSYQPLPFTLLSYLATTTTHVHSLGVLLAHKHAQEKSLGAPNFGLAERKDGILIGLKKGFERNLRKEDRGLVLEVEHRRKSGRGVREWYFLPSQISPTSKTPSTLSAFRETVILLDDHALFRKRLDTTSDTTDADLDGVTFNLSLTDRQKMERENVVLPYFDAQKADIASSGGISDGGRILYDMGVEDDFDDEEDEI